MNAFVTLAKKEKHKMEHTLTQIIAHSYSSRKDKYWAKREAALRVQVSQYRREQLASFLENMYLIFIGMQ